MHIIPIDTLQLSNKLIGCGFTEKQAAGITEILHNLDFSKLAPKADTTMLQYDIMSLQKEMRNDSAIFRAEMQAMRTEFQSDIQAQNAKFQNDMQMQHSKFQSDMNTIRAEFHGEMKAMRAEIRNEMNEIKNEILKWMFGGFVATASLLIAAIKVIH